MKLLSSRINTDGQQVPREPVQLPHPVNSRHHRTSVAGFFMLWHIYGFIRREHAEENAAAGARGKDGVKLDVRMEEAASVCVCV